MPVRRRAPLFLFLAGFLPGGSVAYPDAVDERIAAEMAKRRIPGMALAVVREGKAVKVRGCGWANLELNAPVTVDTVFPLASVSKQFVAAGVLILAQEGRLDLDDTLSRYLQGTPDALAEITLRQLLTHTSGLARDDPLGMQVVPTERALFQSVTALKLDAPPGTEWAYSNLGYNLLSLVIQEVSGEPWEQFLARRIFAPLGMTATRRFSLSAVIPNRAAGYVRVQGVVRNGPMASRDLAAGGLVTTAADLARWAAALDTDTPLTPASREQMWAPGRLKDGRPARARSSGGYGFGWMVTEVAGHRLFAHGGSRPGYTAFLARYPDDRLTVALLINLSGAEPASLAAGVAAVYIPELAGSGRPGTDP
jgi:CubicO group peptidase (beta-lactamase class C family)